MNNSWRDKLIRVGRESTVPLLLTFDEFGDFTGIRSSLCSQLVPKLLKIFEVFSVYFGFDTNVALIKDRNQLLQAKQNLEN